MFTHPLAQPRSPHEPHRSCQQPSKLGGPVMAALIALAAICLFAAGALAGIIGVVAVAIGREDRNLTLTSAAPDNLTRAGRWLTGLHVRAPRGTATAGREKTLV